MFDDIFSSQNILFRKSENKQKIKENSKERIKHHETHL